MSRVTEARAAAFDTRATLDAARTALETAQAEYDAAVVAHAGTMAELHASKAEAAANGNQE